MTSEHLIKLEQFCQENKIAETYRGENPYDNSKPGEWVYFDCYFDAEKIRARFNFPDTIKYHEYDGLSAGQESGFVDDLTNDAVLGNHPYYDKQGNKKRLE